MRIGYPNVVRAQENRCKRIFTDKLSGAQVARPGLNEALSQLRQADTLVVWKLDRLGRSVKGLVDLVNDATGNVPEYPSTQQWPIARDRQDMVFQANMLMKF
jgi:DNA invertase Pin-like site-specific DNA recombinase